MPSGPVVRRSVSAVADPILADATERSPATSIEWSAGDGLPFGLSAPRMGSMPTGYGVTHRSPILLSTAWSRIEASPAVRVARRTGYVNGAASNAPHIEYT